jgi:Tfp pilus assembly protein PilN
MIRINLLPHKKVKTVEKGVQNLRIAVAGLTVAVLLIILYATFQIKSEKASLEQENEELGSQLAGLKKNISEVSGYEKTRLDLEQKVKTIKELEKNRVYLASLLNELNASTTREIWFTTLQSQGPAFTLEGMARNDKKNIDGFVDRLKKSPILANINLQDSKEEAPGSRKFTFKLTGRLAGYEETAAVATGKPAQPQAAGGKAQPAQPQAGKPAAAAPAPNAPAKK